MKLRVHAFKSASRANGPGLRAVVWFQGCSLACPGCFNPATHSRRGGEEVETEQLAEAIMAQPGIEGVTVSGGEPFEQPEAVLDVAQRLRGAGLGVLVFSGYTLEQIRSMPLGPAILERVDAVIDGPYARDLHAGRGLLGSANQRVHLLTSRHRYESFLGGPDSEVILHQDGTVTLSGISPMRLGGAKAG